MSLHVLIHTRPLSVACAFSSSSLARGRLIYDFVFHSFVFVPAVLRKEQRKARVLSARPSQEVPFPQQVKQAWGQVNLGSHLGLVSPS